MAHVYKRARFAFSLPTMETSTRKHRSRSQPTPRRRNTLITDNDIFGIFEPLSRHAQLTTRQLVAFDPRYASTVRNRLTDLYHAEGEWLVRLSETLKLANSLTIDEMHRLGGYAEDLLKVRGIIPSEKWVRTSRVGGNSTAPSRIFRLALIPYRFDSANRITKERTYKLLRGCRPTEAYPAVPGSSTCSDSTGLIG